MNTIKVWDPVVRIGHWLLVAGFTVAYISGEEWDTLHVWAGYLVLGVVAFRIIWGFTGTAPARFWNFITPFSAVKRHLGEVARFEARRYPGHNPAGGWMVVAMLTVILLVSLSGLAVLGAEGEGPLAGMAVATMFGEEGWEEAHEFLANLAVLMVIIHIGGVVVESMLTGENLPKSMVNGVKHLEEQEVK